LPQKQNVQMLPIKTLETGYHTYSTASLLSNSWKATTVHVHRNVEMQNIRLQWQY